MSAINPVPSEYNTLTREQFYPDSVVAEITSAFDLDSARLAQALGEVVESYDDAGHWQTRYPLWLGAKDKAVSSLTKLRLVRREWARASDGIKQTTAASFDNYSAEVMLAQIDNLISVMLELAETKGRGRGNDLTGIF
jgi:hypothetical protein